MGRFSIPSLYFRFALLDCFIRLLVSDYFIYMSYTLYKAYYTGLDMDVSVSTLVGDNGLFYLAPRILPVFGFTVRFGVFRYS